MASTSKQQLESEGPATNNGATAAPVTNKFFRSNRMSGAELKKRTYVTKELQAPAQGRTRSSAVARIEPESSEQSENSAANFMAGVGIVSTPGAFFN